MAKRKTTKKDTANPKSDSTTVNALKCQFLTDMELAGMYLTSRKRYLYVVDRLIRHYWCSPAELTEQQVCDSLLEHHRQRQVPVPPTTLQTLRNLCKANKNKRYLFPNHYGKTHTSESSVRLNIFTRLFHIFAFFI